MSTGREKRRGRVELRGVGCLECSDSDGAGVEKRGSTQTRVLADTRSMLGQIKIPRRPLDDTFVPKGASGFTRGGGFYVVHEGRRLRQWSKFTRCMSQLTFGRWPWGKLDSVPAIRDERITDRND